MPIFTYSARDKLGNLASGEMEGASDAAVKNALLAKGLLPISVKSKSGLSKLSNLPLFQKKPTSKELASLTRQFQVMFAVGTPMDHIFGALAKQLKHPKLKAAFTQIQRDIAGGTRLTAAFSRHSDVFGPLYTSMLEVGESGGVLDKTLKEMASILEKENEIRSKIKSATMYPKIVLFVLLVVSIGMLIFVIPPFKNFYGKSGAELPLPTQIMLGLSDMVMIYWYLPLGLGIAGFIGFKKFEKTPRGKLVLSYIGFHIPVFGRLNILNANARFGHLLAALYRAGVPLSSALGVIGHTMSNIYFEQDVRSLKTGIEQGKSISKCVAETKFFEPMLQEACALGEKTGKLDELLESAAKFYDGEIDDLLKNLSTLIEPFLLVVLFGGVLMLALAVYLPIWNISKVVLPN